MSYRKDRSSTASTAPSETDPKQALLRPEVDLALDILRARHRRMVLLLLKEGEVDTRADVIARAEDGSETLEIELAHNHLPKLEDAGYVEWDRTTDELSTGPRFDEIEPLLELLENHAEVFPPDES